MRLGELFTTFVLTAALVLRMIGTNIAYVFYMAWTFAKRPWR